MDSKMQYSGDEAIARRSLRKKLTFWRFITVVVALFGISGYLIYASVQSDSHRAPKNVIAQVEITNIIFDDLDLLQTLRNIRTNDRVKALLLVIDSPGGTVAGGESIFSHVTKISKKKPVVAIIRGLGASAAYLIASASDRIYALSTSITGSIGVVMVSPNISKLLQRYDIEVHKFASSPYKAEPDPTQPLTPEVRKATQVTIDEMYNWFVDTVARARKFDRAKLLSIANGKVYTGSQALKLKLIDAIGGEDEALNWLYDNKKIDKAVKPQIWWPLPREEEFLVSVIDRLLDEVFGYFGYDPDIIRRVAVGKFGGPMAIWQGG